MQPEELQAIAAFVVEQASRFTVPALLDVLQLLGYDAADIQLRSNPSVAHSSSLIHSVQLAESPRRATITVNLGLMSAQGPLPSYFLQLLATQRDASLTEFLWFFEQPLLAQRFAGLHPERDRSLFPDWDKLRLSLRSLLRLTAPCQLHWLFQHIFPELEVSVRRAARLVPLPAPQAHLGSSGVGDGSALGGFTLVPRSELRVLLLCDSWTAAAEVAWPLVARQRLREQVVPALQAVEPLLDLQMIFRGRSSTAALASDRLLGFDPLGQSPAALPSATPVALFHGVLNQQAFCESAFGPQTKESAYVRSR